MPKSWLAPPIALLAVLLAGCGPAEDPGRPDLSGAETIRAVATTGMIADAVANVGGDRVEVESLMGPGVDPHLYKASEGDVRRLEGADLVFYNGLHLEAKMADVLARVPAARAVAEAIPPGLLKAAGDQQHDPHVWFDVELWRLVVADVRDALAAADPAHAALYRSNATAYLEELAALDAYVSRQASRVPERSRVLITAHDAFSYFGSAYGFDVRGLQGISTVAEAGARDVSELADFIAERRIPAIFVESSVSPRTIEAVQAAVGSRGFDVEVGGSLFSDAMGSEGTAEGTYVGMVRHNVDTIVSGLLGSDPR
jgi:manganese/zinc/iron transport system substrate-binding protein